MTKTNYPLEKIDWEKVETLSYNIANKIIKDNKKIDVIIPILRGGMPVALLLSSMLDVSEMACIHIRRSLDDNPNTEFGAPINKGVTNAEVIKNANVLIVDDTLDSSKTLDFAINIIDKFGPKSINIASLYNFNKSTFDKVYSGEEVTKYKWIIFPWEDKKI